MEKERRGKRKKGEGKEEEKGEEKKEEKGEEKKKKKKKKKKKGKEERKRKKKQRKGMRFFFTHASFFSRLGTKLPERNFRFYCAHADACALIIVMVHVIHSMDFQYHGCLNHWSPC